MELTTLRVEKQIVEWLNTLKGFLEYNSGKKLTLNDALLSILMEIDILYAMRQKLINPYNSSEVNNFIKNRINQFWGETAKDKPMPITFFPKDILTVEKYVKNQMKKKKDDMPP